MKKLLWIDTETTGLSSKKNGIIEIAGIIDIDGKNEKEFLLRMNPVNREINPGALGINGFTRERIKTLKPWTLVYIDFISGLTKEFHRFGKDQKFILAGQNIAFDNRMVVGWAEECNALEYYENLVNTDKRTFIDTQKISKDFSGLEDHKLGTICKRFGVDLKGAHTALGDIKATREVYYKMLEANNG